MLTISFERGVRVRERLDAAGDAETSNALSWDLSTSGATARSPAYVDRAPGHEPVVRPFFPTSPL
jgi:hypothetical protein